MVLIRRASAYRVISASDRWGSRRLAPLALVVIGFLQPHLAGAENILPSGGTVTDGQVAITTPGAGHLVLNQGSDRAIVNWDSFSIGHGNTVDIHQPSTSSAILNRVTGDTTSEIHGRLNANGEVFVVNPNGIFIGADGEVTAGGGFVGSTLDISDANFKANRLGFEGVGKSAAVTNEGRVVIGRGGFAALLGGRVSNSGLVMVPMGRIGLGAGERATLDVSGDRFLQVEIPSEGDSDEMRALIENAGTLSAEGGLIELQAATARHAARHAINLSGVADASSVSVQGGTIVLGGGAGGRVTVSGKVRTAPKRPAIIVAQSPRPKARRGGGDVTITGRSIELTGAEIDASWSGGVVRIGGDYQGGGGLPHALYLGVDAETTINADAGATGDGGRVILWSDERTEFAGTITARGGSESGDGGFVEVSGKQTLAFGGTVDTSAANGDFGTLLLDPYNITIADVSPSVGVFRDEEELDSDDVVLDPGDVLLDPGDVLLVALTAGGLPSVNFLSGADDSILSVNELEDALALNNVVVDTSGLQFGSQAGDITVSSEVNWDAETALQLRADNDVFLNAGIVGQNGIFEIDAQGQITTGVDGSVDVGRFHLVNGNWRQVGDLPAFHADDFYLGTSANTSFLRATTGLGTQADPYVIADVFGLQGIGSQALLGQSFALGQDIDASGTENWNDEAGFISIGTDVAFTGTLTSVTAEPSTITGLTSLETGGLFGLTVDAELTDFVLNELDVFGSGNVGGLANATVDTIIDGVTVTGSVDSISSENVGGLIGLMSTVQGASGFGTELSNSRFEGTVTAIDGPAGDELAVDLGGLVGSNIFGTIIGSSFLGTVSDEVTGNNDRRVGGAVGTNVGSMSFVDVIGDVRSLGAGGRRFVGGLVGQDSGDFNDADSVSVFASQVDATINVASLTDDEIEVGGLVGFGVGFVLNSLSDGVIDVQSRGGSVAVGGAIGNNRGEAVGVRSTSSVLVDNNAVEDGIVISDNTQAIGGFVGLNTGTIEDAAAFGTVTVTARSVESAVGGFVGANGVTEDFIDDGGEVTPGSTGTISVSQATGALDVTTDREGAVGGFVGLNEGNIQDAFSEGAVTLAMPSFAGGALVSDTGAAVGGFAGITEGTIARTAARGGNAEATVTTIEAYVGGHTGVFANGVLRDSYSTIDVNSTSDVETINSPDVFANHAGGFIGYTITGNVTNVFSSGLATETNLREDFVVNEFSRQNLVTLRRVGPTEAVVTAGYFAGSFTQELSDDPSNGQFGLSLSEELLTDTDAFFARASADGWDFANVWAPSAPGRGPSLYSLDAVVFAEPDAAPVQLAYGATLTGVPIGTVNGAPDLFLFGSENDTLDVSSVFGDVVIVGDAIGVRNFDLVTDDLTSDLGQTYAVVALSGVAEVAPAPLTITLDNENKVFGQTVTFDGTEFALDPGQLFFDDAAQLSTLDIFSDGAVFDADVIEGGYAIVASLPEGESALDNYNITFENGTLSVSPLALILESTDQSKGYGEAFTFDAADFSIGIDAAAVDLDSITIDPLTFPTASDFEFSSDGAAADAFVGVYDITGTEVEGLSLGDNFTLATNVATGTLTVDPAAVTLQIRDAQKTYGTLGTLDGSGFDVAEGTFFFDDLAAFGPLLFASEGVVADATVVDGGYAITGVASGNAVQDNYDVTIVDGQLTVNPAPLILTLDSASKTYGEALSFAGTEFTVTSGEFFFADEAAFGSLTITSEGAVSDADVGAYSIVGTSLAGTDVAANYSVSIEDGTLTVDPAAVTLTVDSTVKTYGDTVTFDGSEFTITSGQFFFADEAAFGPLTLTSDGAVADADAGTYVIDGAETPENDVAANYSVTIENGALTVDPAALSLRVADARKTYGTLATLDGSQFDVTEGAFLFDDLAAFGSLVLASEGTAAEAPVLEGGYSITAVTAGDAIQNNYNITILGATLTVDPVALTLSLDSAAKTYGEAVTFDGTEFTVTSGEFFFADEAAFGPLTITSDGAAEDVNVDTFAIIGTGPSDSTVAANYSLTVEDGTLTVNPAALILTVNSTAKTYGEEVTFDGSEFSVTSGEFFFADEAAFGPLTIISDGAAADADVGSYTTTGTASAESDVAANYSVIVEDGALTVDPAALILTVNSRAKTYGEVVAFDGTEFTVSSGEFFFADEAAFGPLSITSDGAAEDADVRADNYAIRGNTASENDIASNYDVTVLDGTLTVRQAALTLRANDAVKTFGEQLIFVGNEFSVLEGMLRFGDTIDTIALRSDGALADAAVGSFEIIGGGPVSGVGLGNYNIGNVLSGSLVVEREIVTPPPPLLPPVSLPVITDNIVTVIDVLDSGSASTTGGGAGGTAVNTAQQTLETVQALAGRLDVSGRGCEGGSANVSRYLACLSDSLDDFAAELDLISTDLPPGFENVATIVRDARQGVQRAQARAQTRLATATTDAQRAQIRAEAVNEARATLQNAASDIRASISLVRADDPELAAVQRATISTVALAVDTAGIELARATEL